MSPADLRKLMEAARFPSIRNRTDEAEFCLDFVETCERVMPHLLELWEAAKALHAETTYHEPVSLATGAWLRALAKLDAEVGG